MSEDIIIDLIYHYYSTTSLIHSRITPFRKYQHQKNEDFDSFMTRAQRIITGANIPTLTIDQLAILIHVDMMTNRYLIEEVHKDFENIFSMTYSQALYKFRSIHNVLALSKTKKNMMEKGKGP